MLTFRKCENRVTFRPSDVFEWCIWRSDISTKLSFDKNFRRSVLLDDVSVDELSAQIRTHCLTCNILISTFVILIIFHSLFLVRFDSSLEWGMPRVESTKTRKFTWDFEILGFCCSERTIPHKHTHIYYCMHNTRTAFKQNLYCTLTQIPIGLNIQGWRLIFSIRIILASLARDNIGFVTN